MILRIILNKIVMRWSFTLSISVHLVLFFLLSILVLPAFAGTGTETLSDAVNAASSAAPANTRYGPFGVLDSRSQYGLGVIPEPFLVDDSDLEVNEFRLDILDTRSGAQHVDLFKTEIERGSVR
jgi:hypothetical protein